MEEMIIRCIGATNPFQYAVKSNSDSFSFIRIVIGGT